MVKNKFIQRVLQIMNEHGWHKEYPGALTGPDTLRVEDHIQNTFVDAWRKAVNVFPKTYFTVQGFSDQRLFPDTASGTGSIILPDDFYQLYSFKMKGWQKPVEIVYESSDPIASIQANEYTRGNICRPVCVKNIRQIKRREGDLVLYDSAIVLDYYSLPSGIEHNVETALYIPLIKQLDDSIIIGDNLFIPLAYLTAGVVLLLLDHSETSQLLENKAIELIK